MIILLPSENTLTKFFPQNLRILVLLLTNILYSFTNGAKEIQIVYWTISNDKNNLPLLSDLEILLSDT